MARRARASFPARRLLTMTARNPEGVFPMQENPGALDKLYSMLDEAESLGLSRPARLRLVGIIGSLETEELDRFRSRYDTGLPETERVRADDEHGTQTSHRH